MKRRVLRTHNNKKALRTIQAAHALKDPYHVLCDETFLRAVVGQSDVESVRSLIADSGIGAAYVMHVLPETLRNLERHQHFKALEYATANCVVVPTEILSNNTAPPPRASATTTATSTSPVPPVDVSQQPAADRNELKAIAATIKHSSVASSTSSPSAAKNNFFYFVATQSHDLRALLPPAAAILRATFKPTAVWIEINNASGSSANLRDSPASATSNTNRLAHQQRRLSLSGADAAFLESLGINNKTGKKRLAERKPRALTPTPTNTTTTSVALMQQEESSGNTGTTEGAAAAAALQQPPKKFVLKKDNKPKGANPLSMKKKSPRETFSIQQEPPKNKRRVEAPI
jgi:hypothetical protein